MKVLLINPPYPFEESPTPPFGLTSLAAYLLERGIDVRIEDYIITRFSCERVRRLIDEYKPDVVGSTGVTMNINNALEILKCYKEEKPDIVTVMGGPHVTFDAENVLSQKQHVDYIVRGEGEITFTEMLERLEAGDSMQEVLGLSYRQNGSVVHNPNRPLIPNINILPFPARHLIPLSKYRAMGMSINMITSRGCPFGCIFCVGSKMVGKKLRYFDTDRVVEEFGMLTKLGFKQINIVDDLFTSNKKRCFAVCDGIIDKGFAFPWTGFARVDTVSRDLLEKLKESGCTWLCFGTESGNQEILDRIKKKITVEQTRRAIDLCHEVGIEPFASFILGLPGETRETAQQTIDFAKNLTKNYGFHILAPFPGTEVRDKSEEYGMTITTDDWDRYDANQSIAETGGIPGAEIERMVNEFNEMINEYIDELKVKKERGEELGESDDEIITGIKTFLFTHNFIFNELVESYVPGVNGSREDIIENFTQYVAMNTDSSAEESRKQIDRLISMNCIIVDEKHNPAIRWN